MNRLETTELLKQWQNGDEQAFKLLIERVYDELKVLAKRKLLDEFHGSGLQTTELLNEACLLLMGKRENVDWKSRKHFMHTAGLAMYRFLVDEARRRNTQRLGGNLIQVPLADDHECFSINVEMVLRLEKIFDELEKEDPLLVNIAKLRYFAGYTIAETAEIIGEPTVKVNRKWAFAKAIITKQLNDSSTA